MRYAEVRVFEGRGGAKKPGQLHLRSQASNDILCANLMRLRPAMSRRAMSAAWLVLVAGCFVALCVWYGGDGRPLTRSEGAALLNQIAAQSAPDVRGLHPEFRHNLESLIAHDDGREFVMVNLEILRPGTVAEREDAAYARAVIPALLKRGCLPIYVGKVAGPVLGTGELTVQRVGLVRYRSLRDLLLMNLDPRMIAGAPHKFAALERTQVLVSRPILNFAAVRLIAGLAFAFVGLTGWWFMARLGPGLTPDKPTHWAASRQP